MEWRQELPQLAHKWVTFRTPMESFRLYLRVNFAVAQRRNIETFAKEYFADRDLRYVDVRVGSAVVGVLDGVVFVLCVYEIDRLIR